MSSPGWAWRRIWSRWALAPPSTVERVDTRHAGVAILRLGAEGVGADGVERCLDIVRLDVAFAEPDDDGEVVQAVQLAVASVLEIGEYVLQRSDDLTARQVVGQRPVVAQPHGDRRSLADDDQCVLHISSKRYALSLDATESYYLY